MLTIEYLCVLLVGYGLKRGVERITRQHVAVQGGYVTENSEFKHF
jgi:hypothetical protein